jgi:hypothetical protein
VLFHFFRHAAAEPLQDGFLAYLQEAVKGKGQASTFRRIFRPVLKAVEKEYLAYGGRKR